jgi:TPR repeat protein
VWPERDLTRSFKFCRMAAEGGLAKCQKCIAARYSKGESVEPDQRKAAAWYLRAAKEGGDAVAQFVTAQRYNTGNGHDAPNMKEAVKWYQAAVAQGHCGAQFVLGCYYEEGKGVEKNPGLALELWRKCAQHHETGDHAKNFRLVWPHGFDWSVAAAHNNIADAYCHGSNGVEMDMMMAM